jgi:hypothetical protein
MKPLSILCLVLLVIAGASAVWREIARGGTGLLDLCLVALVAAAASWFIERRP